MPYTLGDVTLPRPKAFAREILEVSNENITLYGKTTKNTLHRKERYVLAFTNIRLSTVNSILSEYELNIPRTFTVDETNMSVGPVDVLIDVSERQYPPTGKTYVEDFKLVLTEVKE